MNVRFISFDPLRIDNGRVHIDAPADQNANKSHANALSVAAVTTLTPGVVGHCPITIGAAMLAGQIGNRFGKITGNLSKF